MKKLILMLFVGLFSLTTTAQNLGYDSWTLLPYVDEFERATGDTAKVVLCKGKFSNSATVDNERFAAKITIDQKSETISIGLFEYNRMPSASMGYKSTFGTVIALVGKNSEAAKTFSKVFAPSSGGLYITKSDNPTLYDAICNESYIYFLVKGSEFGGRSSTRYNFTLNLK